MIISNLKRVLLAGTAISVIGALVPMAISQAWADDLTLTGNSQWTLGGGGGAGAASGGDNVDVDGNRLQVFNNNAGDDGGGGGVGNFTIGDITDSDTGAVGTGAVSVTSTGAGGLDTNVTIGSVSVADYFEVKNDDINTSSITATVTGDVTTGGDLDVINNEDASPDSVSLTIAGDVVVGGTVHVTIASGAVAHATILSLGGNVTAAGGFLLSEVVGAEDATLEFNGSGAQLVSGAIVALADGSGLVLITNTDTISGVTFNNDIGSGTEAVSIIMVDNDGNDQLVTFTNNVFTQNGLFLGDNTGGDAITANFGGAADTTVSGGITSGASENVLINVVGGNTVTQQNGSWTGSNGLIIDTDTTLISESDISVGSVLVRSGGVLDINNMSATAFTAISGSITLAEGATVKTSAASTITGNLLGASGTTNGTLDVDADTTVTGVVGSTGGSGLFAVDIATGTTLTVGTHVNALTTTLNGTGVLATSTSVGGNEIIGNVVAAVDGDGVIDITATGTELAIIRDDIGTSAASVGNLTISGSAGANELRLYGDAYVDTISLGENDALRFLDASTGATQIVSGAIVASNDTGASIVIGTGGVTVPIVTFNGVIGGNSNIDDLTVHAGSMAIFNNDADFDGALSADAATIQVKESFTLVAATQTDADVTTWNIGVNNTGGTQTHGVVQFTGDAVDLSNDTVHFVVSATSDPLIVGASVLDNVFIGNAQNVIAGSTVTDSSFFYDFILVDDTNNVDVTIVQAVTLSEVSETTNNAKIGEVLLNELAGSTNTEISQIQANLGAASTASELNDILEASGPTVDGGAVAGVLAVSGGALNIARTRLASLNTGAESGISAGNIAEGTQVWMQAFGATGHQNSRGNIDGFDVNSGGLAAGMDTKNFAEDTVVGLAFSYGGTSVNSKNANRTNTRIDSYQLSLYGDHDFDGRTYFSGQMAYAWNDVKTTRHDVGGIAGLNAIGEYGADLFSASAELGHSFSNNGTTITPRVTANYSHFNPHSYTETGAGGANLNVAGENINIFELGVGVDISHDFQLADGSILTPAMHVAYRRDLIGDMAAMSSSFVGGGSTFKTGGAAPAQDTIDLGVGLTYVRADEWELTANYNFEYKSDYNAHTGFVHVAHTF